MKFKVKYVFFKLENNQSHITKTMFYVGEMTTASAMSSQSVLLAARLTELLAKLAAVSSYLHIHTAPHLFDCENNMGPTFTLSQR